MIKFLYNSDAAGQSLPDPMQLCPREILARLQRQDGIDQVPQDLRRIALHLSGEGAQWISKLLSLAQDANLAAARPGDKSFLLQNSQMVLNARWAMQAQAREI